MQPTLREIEQAVESLEALKFFPLNSAGAKAAVIGLVRCMISDVAQLDWLTDTLLNRVGEWPGTAEVRAVFCTRFKPADGIEGWSKLSGFTASDSEARYAIEAGEHKQLELAAPKAGGGLVRVANCEVACGE